jgi:hypothetical protein
MNYIFLRDVFLVIDHPIPCDYQAVKYKILSYALFSSINVQSPVCIQGTSNLENDLGSFLVVNLGLTVLSQEQVGYNFVLFKW